MKILIITICTLTIGFAKELTVIYEVNGMMCAKNCPQKIHESLKGIEGIISCEVNFQTKKAIVIYDNDKIDSDKIASIISKFTYYKT